MKKSLFAVCFLIVSCLLVASCGKNEKSDFLKFKNEYFSFEYPASWILEEGTNNISVVGPDIDGYYVNTKIDYNTSIALTLEDFTEVVELQNKVDELPDFIDGGIKLIQIGGIDANKRILQTTVPSSNGNQMLYVTLTYAVVEPSLGIVVTTECSVSNYLEYEDTLDKILNSINFGDW
ncbi:MAG: hypothetical protein KAH01_00065 [Caldisericia bacterium]|nr:hypothetical protein [Caldisericia bacterium]